MKTSIWAAPAVAALAVGAFCIPTSLAQSGNPPSTADPTIPATPVGVLTATPSVVQTGTNPLLNWAIVYPSKVDDVALIKPPGSIELSESMYVSVRPVGVGVTGSSSGVDIGAIPAELRMSVDRSSFFQLFYGTAADVDPGYSLYIKKLPAGTVLDFGSRHVEGGQWSSFYTTRSSNTQVIALTDGDTVPTTFDLSQSGKLAPYLKPYIDGTGKIQIGPMSVLILAETATTNHASTSFDYQDVVALVTFSTKHPNNGHGNNLDGVDVSNPGKGSGGPNGEVDPSGGVDDEIR